MFFVFVNLVQEYEDVVEEYMHKNANIGVEYVRHKPLKCRGSVAVSLLHYEALERALYRGEIGFRHVLGLDAYLFIRIGHVKFRSILGTRDVVPDIVLIREWGDVLDGIVIPEAEVDYGS